MKRKIGYITLFLIFVGAFVWWFFFKKTVTSQSDRPAVIFREVMTSYTLSFDQPKIQDCDITLKGINYETKTADILFNNEVLYAKEGNGFSETNIHLCHVNKTSISIGIATPEVEINPYNSLNKSLLPWYKRLWYRRYWR